MKGKDYVSAVIVGAGNGTRMGGVNKALIKIGDETAFRMVLRAFFAAPCIDEIVVVCRDKAELEGEAAGFGGKPLRFVLGGATRAESVLNGVKAASGKCTAYCIHDCARPLVTPEIIADVVSAGLEYGAATVCTSVTDTVKYVNTETNTVYTPERKRLRAVQTPQVIKKDIYMLSILTAKADGFTATDDTALVEHAGKRVRYVETDKSNIKLTCAEDVYMARFLALRRKKEHKE